MITKITSKIRNKGSSTFRNRKINSSIDRNNLKLSRISNQFLNKNDNNNNKFHQQPNFKNNTNFRRFCTKSNDSRLITVDPKLIKKALTSNVTPTIENKVGTNLHLRVNHPLNILQTRINNYFENYDQNNPKIIEENAKPWRIYNNLSPYVTHQQNFDDLLIPKDHVSRSPSDTYYINDKYLLRTHMSAHQTQLLKENNNQNGNGFLFAGDVYRRDEIDATHYPVFHQCDAIKTFPRTLLLEKTKDNQETLILEDMKKSLEGLVFHLFGKVETRWIDAYFPFTNPSLELEIFFNNEWLEVLGSGVMQQKILDSVNQSDKKGWAFGLGLERLAMVLFDIPDIRLFWSNDIRFLKQFKKGEIKKFKSYSKYPPCIKDISFWVNEEDKFHQNDLFDLIRSEAGDVVESVLHQSSFRHPKTNRLSQHFQINFRSMDRSLTNEEINTLQNHIRDKVTEKLPVELR